MSLLPPDSIKSMAEFVGIANLKQDVCIAIAQDIEYRLRDIIQVISPIDPVNELNAKFAGSLEIYATQSSDEIVHGRR